MNRRARWASGACVATQLVAAACAHSTAPRVIPAAAIPSPPAITFEVTAYCRGTITAAGTRVAPGVVAADPAVLPIGTQVRVSGLADAYNGVYLVMDIGPRIKGQRLDMYMTSCTEAVQFGRQRADVTVIDP